MTEPRRGPSRGYVPSRHPARQLFRVEFPFGQRPTARWEGKEHEVLDISEKGMRLSMDGIPRFNPGSSVRLTVKFFEASETVEGSVLRCTDREAVLTLTKGFPLERIRREERRLIQASRTEPPSP